MDETSKFARIHRMKGVMWHALQFIQFMAVHGSYSSYELSAQVHEFP